MSEDEREDGKLPGSFKAPDCAQLNKLLPAFKFRELIACGGMGAVYRARQLSLGRDVAIKVLPPEISAAGSVFVESFKTEARTMASLSHPNLVGIHDFGEVSGMLYLVMEYIDGNALYRSIKGQKVKPVQAVVIVEGVARGLGEAHERGLLHRDIKPANILLTSKRKPVLGDFGLVVRSDAVGSGLNMGTPGYTAPEVVRDFEAASTSSDVYALGMILHEMLSGVMPTGEHAPDLSLVPDMNGLRRLVGRVVSSDPSQRPADGEALAGELASWLERAQRMKGLVLSPAATVARPAQPIVRSPGVGRKKGLVLSPRAPLLTPTAGNSEAPAPVAAPQAQVAIGPNWSLLRNLIIIVLLIGAIYGMTRAYKWQKQNIAKQDPQPEQVIPGPRKQPSPPAPVAKPSPAVVEPPQPKVSDFKWAVNDRKATIKAAEQGNANAQFSLGNGYANGDGVAKDYTEAVKWYRKSAEQGLADAQNNLGLCYHKGEGVPEDYTEAVKWFRKAAEQGQADAQNNLGVCYKDGDGVAKDDVIA